MMPRERILKIVIVCTAALLVGGAGFVYLKTRVPSVRRACTLEAKLCPDGSAVGRTGPNCEFAACPPSNVPPAPPPSANCTSDAQCPSGAVCEATQGSGTVSPNGGPSTFTIEKGQCKWKEGSRCAASADCQAGLLCHGGVCTSPQGDECSGAEGSCAQGYRCVQDCGPPVVRQDEPPPAWHCVLDEVASQPRICPICLASNTVIETPDGKISVQDVKVGTVVWSLDHRGEKIASKVIRISRTPVPVTHQVIHLVMDDGREVWVSPGHPTADGRPVSTLRAGDAYDGGTISEAELVPYWDAATYDLLPDSATGAYWANGVLLGSTLSLISDNTQ